MIKFSSDTRINYLIEAFSRDRNQTIDSVYVHYRKEFLGFIKKYSIDEELNIDCYQDTIISLYENLCHEKITSDKSTVKTYLFAIGKNLILNAIKKNQKLGLHENLSGDNLFAPEIQNNEYNEILLAAINSLGEKCQSILKKYYYENYSIDAIMHAMEYKNENTVKAHKSRCLSKLKDLFNQLKHT